MWKIVKISDVCEFQSGLWKGKKGPLVNANVIRNTNFKPDGNLSYENVANLQVEAKELSKRQLQYGDIILEKSGGGEKTPVGRVCLFEKKDNKIPFSLSNFTCLIRVKQPSVLDYKFLHKFLYFIYLSGQTESMQRNSTGIRNLQLKEYKNISISLPPIKEQQHIVAKLDAAFAEIDKEINASKNKQKIVDSLKKNILAKKFELDSDVIKLGDLCEVITKGTTPTSLGYKFIDKGINFIKIESITNIGNFIKSKFAYINKDCNAALKRSQLQAGDILFSIAGALGRTAIVTEEILPANTNQALAILRIKKDIKIDKKFLLHCLNSDVVKKQSDTFKGGTAQQNLSLSQLKSYNIPLPSLVKQKDIVTKLDLIFTEIHKLKNLIEMKIKNYQTLSYAILKKELQKETA